MCRVLQLFSVLAKEKVSNCVAILASPPLKLRLDLCADSRCVFHESCKSGRGLRFNIFRKKTIAKHILLSPLCEEIVILPSVDSFEAKYQILVSFSALYGDNYTVFIIIPISEII